MRLVGTWTFFGILISHFAFGASYPKTLTEWEVFEVKGDKLDLGPRTMVYDIVNPLFSDYAQKFRTLTLPEGSAIRYQEDGSLDFPDGTILSKTFAYPVAEVARKDSGQTVGLPYTLTGQAKGLEGLHLLETRILFKSNGRWVGLPYVWSEDQTEANLKIIGQKIPVSLVRDTQQVDIDYQVPHLNQCKGCHIKQEGFSKTVVPIGPKVKNLNREHPLVESNQLSHWQAMGLIEGLGEISDLPKMASWEGLEEPVEARARAYLDINCSHCHSETGPADSSSLYLNSEETRLLNLGFCKSPVATGNGGSGDSFVIDPGHPESSILIHRMNSLDPAEMMPEIGRHLVHKESVDLMSEWIQTLTESCH